MGPFGIPWSSFAAFLLAAATIVLALVWAAIDRARESRANRRGEDGGGAQHAREGGEGRR